jgi:hypothetical protein
MTKDWVPPKRRNPVVSSGASGDTELFEKPVISTVFKADE